MTCISRVKRVPPAAEFAPKTEVLLCELGLERPRGAVLTAAGAIT
jgi:hypothetical protein